MIKYANGTNYLKNNTKKQAKTPSKHKYFSYGNRGMSFEEDINVTNEFYKEKGLCLITKRPTPINVVKVNYTKGAIITEAFFEKQSTTDYNGVYKGKYIDFEAKSTIKTTSFPFSNISKHQIEHLKNVIIHNGIAFFIIEFASLNEVYLLDAQYVIDCYENNQRKSLPYSQIKEVGYEVKKGFAPRLDYLDIIEKIYCKS